MFWGKIKIFVQIININIHCEKFKTVTQIKITLNNVISK